MFLSRKLPRCILNFQHRLFSKYLNYNLVSNKPQCLFRVTSTPKTSLDFYRPPCQQCYWMVFVKTMAGHSKWQNIRHIKAAKDKQKSDLAFRFSQKIRITIKETGESNPKFNNKLDRIIQDAKKVGIPNPTIQNAIKSAIASQTASESYNMEVKCFGPIVLILIISSASVTHTKQELFAIFKKHNVKYVPRCSEGMFEKKGVIHMTPMEGFDLVNALDLAIEVNAEDVLQEKDEDDSPYLKFICDFKDINSMVSSLKELGHDITYSEWEYIPTIVYPVDENHMKLLVKLFEKIYSFPEVVRIFDNIAE